MSPKKILLVVVIAAALASFFIFDLGNYLSFETIKGQQREFNDFYLAHKWQTIGLFIVVYVVSVALSFPGAAVLTIVAGAIFGVWQGTVIVSLASTLGATLACLASRFIFRDYVQRRFASRLKRINESMEREGAFYLFTVRLVPYIPFFVINLVFGLTKIRIWTYVWVSWIGMLAGTIVFVNAGTQLSQLEKPGDILSADIIISFLLLGFFPLIARRMISFFKKGKQ